MRALDELMVKVRRRETPLYARLYQWAKAVRSVHMPVIPGVHHLLYEERRVRHAVVKGLLRVLYYEPLFKTQCERVGRNLRIIGGLPQLLGSPIRITVGHDVTLSGVITVVGSKAARDPVLDIGDGSYIGYQTTIVTGRGIHIGRHVLIANRVVIAGDDSHPTDPVARRNGEPPAGQDVKSVWIDDDVWIADGAMILKGVQIGRGAVVAAKAVVTSDVPPSTVVAGNPARVVKEVSGTHVAGATDVLAARAGSL
jgi:acetyltransferase-like isoleucine patch superfamily enzyme